MRVAYVLAGVGVLLSSAVVRADQAAWNSKKDADAGAALIHVGQEIRDYCAPCGETAYTARSVSNVTVGQPDPQYWEVRVNGRGVDLAYEYVRIDGRWKNVAMAIGLQVTGVPPELPASLPRR